MKKKILIGSILAALLMLSMPVISNIQAQPTLVSGYKETEECNICPNILDEKPPCDNPFCDSALLIINLLTSGILPFVIIKIIVTSFIWVPLNRWYNNNCYC